MYIIAEGRDLRKVARFSVINYDTNYGSVYARVKDCNKYRYLFPTNSYKKSFFTKTFTI